MGNRRQMVILASFQDQDFTDGTAAAMTMWNRIFNEENFTEGMYVGSVRDYFMAQSYGAFRLTFDLIAVELPDMRYKYRSTAYDDEYSQYLVDDIVDALQTQDIDWSLYDWDGDMFVDQLLIIFAGKGMSAGGDSNTIWPHQWWLSQHLNLETPDANDYRSYRTVTRGDQSYYIDCYCCVQEVVNIASAKSSFGTLCHEYSHCFGLPDFYYNTAKVVGSWDLMDYGCVNGQGFCPCNYSAHERMVMGWLTPIELTSKATITDMPALTEAPVAYLIRNDGAEDEYYIIENRQQSGWDEHQPGSGILIFHVEYDRHIWEEPNDYPNNPNHLRYTIFPANNNGRTSAGSGWGYPYVVTGEDGISTVVNDSLTNTSSPAATLNQPNADGEKLMSKPITHMVVHPDKRASFFFMDDETTSISEEIRVKNEESADAWYDLSGRKFKNSTPELKNLPRGIMIHQGRKIKVK